MNIPYRTRLALKRVGAVALMILLVAILAGMCLFVWLKRFVVYTRTEGAVLDMSLSAQIRPGEVAVPPKQPEIVDIYYNEGDNTINTSKELQKISGYYVDTAALKNGLETVWQQIQALPAETPIMLDVKSAKGNFYYSSTLSGNRETKIDPVQMDELIDKLRQSGRYLIARLPALRDRQYGLNNVSDGIFDTRGAYLFSDGGIYWLNPTRQGTISYLVQIVTELKSLGFDEVVFDSFRFPETEYMRFDGDKAQALASAAKTLVTTCATENFAVSFVQTPDFALPEGRSRLYLEGIAAAGAEGVAQQIGIAKPEVYLVFLTEVHDTRFDVYSVLRPLDAAR